MQVSELSNSKSSIQSALGKQSNDLQVLDIILLLYKQQYNLPFMVCNFTPSRKH